MVLSISELDSQMRPLTRITVQQGVYSHPQSDTAVYWNSYNQQTNLRFLRRRLGGWDLVVGKSLVTMDLGPEIYRDSLGNQTGWLQITTIHYGR